MSAPAPSHLAGMDLIRAGRCPLGAQHPMACWTCPVGHATECHFPSTCEEAQCGHLAAAMEIDELPESGDAGLDDAIAIAEDEAYAVDRAEAERQRRIAAGAEHACAACGCSESCACPGGCVWATPTLCSRCV